MYTKPKNKQTNKINYAKLLNKAYLRKTIRGLGHARRSAGRRARCWITSKKVSGYRSPGRSAFLFVYEERVQKKIADFGRYPQ